MSAPVPGPGGQDHAAWRRGPAREARRAAGAGRRLRGRVVARAARAAASTCCAILHADDLAGPGRRRHPLPPPGAVWTWRATPGTTPRRSPSPTSRALEPPVWTPRSTCRRRAHRRASPRGARPRPGGVRSSGTDLPGAGRHLVPATVVRHRDTPLDGTAPALLYAYGAYEYTFEPEWDPAAARRCSTAASSSCTPTSAAAARAAGAGSSTAGCTPSRTPSPTTSRSPTASPRRAWSTATGSPPAASARAACCRARCSASGPTAGGRSWPRCRSSTSSPPCSTTSIPLTVNEWDEWGDPHVREQFDGCSPTRRTTTSLPRGRPPRPAGHRRRPRRAGDGARAREVGRARCATPTRTGRRAACSASRSAPAPTRAVGRFGHLAYEAEVYAWVLDRLGVADPRRRFRDGRCATSSTSGNVARHDTSAGRWLRRAARPVSKPPDANGHLGCPRGPPDLHRAPAGRVVRRPPRRRPGDRAARLRRVLPLRPLPRDGRPTACPDRPTPG